MDKITPGSELFRQLTDLLRQRIGLNPDSVGKQTLEHAVGHRLKALRMTNAAEYVARLARDTTEWNEFLEEIIVPESWFFRELTPFQCVRQFAREAMAMTGRSGPLRFLSMPCSRGEEPYSLAMTLLDAGLSPQQFEIVACDLSPRSLEFARRGRYRSIAFRETDGVSQRLMRQHFQQHGDEWWLDANVRDRVRFQPANLALPESLAGLGRFDFIFCRNVLIYLTGEVRQAALTTFKRQLTPGGILYLGHSECRLGPQAGAVAWRDEFPAAFTWNQLGNNQVANKMSSNAASQTFPSNLNVSTRSKAPIESATQLRAATPNHPVIKDAAASSASKPVRDGSQHTEHELLRARELANAGKLNEAEAICQRIIQQNPTSADIYCLLGVIVQARGDFTQADSHFQRSLFLQPNHRESLTHVLLLAERRGDQKSVANYQRRLTRLRNQGT